ncbi:sulfite exporter TauE/SafE family protein [Streptomyces spiramenti]|uniref:Probable membrane transporter protein n=1 Tax=Streptomyces spiramenti TaxID=2720606 RepID=A0ABX1AJV1_9ACTN|nr:sulfite exporter TauE/SafE family protein [Streptomyces spiramenti]NJP67402.1 sulfite exporter TauE/SafE family protein [Streptomyces spiramenti]
MGWEWVAVLGAGFWAGMINVVVGSGTLVTFPVLLLFGYPPLVANISNNIGLVGGNLSGTFGYRRELAEKRTLTRVLLPAATAGGVTGAVLLLVLPPEAFRAVVPGLILLGLVMVVAAPAVQRRAAARGGGALSGSALSGRRTAAVATGVFCLGVYGGYFGAAQGILLVGLLGVLTAESLQSTNAIKNLLVTAVNAVAAVVFLLVAWEYVDWGVVALVAGGATLGGLVGARVGRRLPPALLRALIVVVGGAALVHLVFFV